MKKTTEGICPACGSSFFVPIEDAYEGNIVRCPDCGARLAIIDDNPLEFEEILEDDEGDL